MKYFLQITFVLSLIIVIVGGYSLTRKSPTGQMKVTENIFKAVMEAKLSLPSKADKGKSQISFGAAPAQGNFPPPAEGAFSYNNEAGEMDINFDMNDFGSTPSSGGDFAVSGALTEEDYGSPKNYSAKEKPANPSMEEPLISAVAANNMAEVRRLLAEGASPNTINNATSATPLFTAISANNPEMVSLLLDFGASQNQVNDKGFMPIHEAAAGGAYGDSKSFKSDEIIVFLLENGADINQKNVKGQTPLMLAAKAKKAATVRFLIHNGARTDIRDTQGKTALSIAQEANCKDCADILLAEDAIVQGAI